MGLGGQSHFPATSSTRKKPFYRRVGGLEGPSGRMRDSSTPMVFDSPHRIIVAIPIELSWPTAVSRHIFIPNITRGNFQSIAATCILNYNLSHGYMFRLIASHHQAKELKDLSKQLLHMKRLSSLREHIRLYTICLAKRDLLTNRVTSKLKLKLKHTALARRWLLLDVLQVHLLVFNR
jgi:hypothetical protein